MEAVEEVGVVDADALAGGDAGQGSGDGSRPREPRMTTCAPSSSWAWSQRSSPRACLKVTKRLPRADSPTRTVSPSRS